jgi:hypothetical protein
MGGAGGVHEVSLGVTTQAGKPQGIHQLHDNTSHMIQQKHVRVAFYMHAHVLHLFAPRMCVLLMQGQTEPKTIAALQALLEEASAFAPCLLALKHFKDLTAHAGTASGGTQGMGEKGGGC